MTLPASGAISLANIQTEFGGSNPISLSEYYRGGSFVSDNNTSVPTSGLVSLSNFYGAVAQYEFTFSSNTQEADLRALAISAGWNGSDQLKVLVNSGVYLWSNSITTGGLVISGAFPAGVILLNSGYIIGKGGKGGNFSSNNKENGGPALQITATVPVDVTNNASAFIAGGGGGGAGGSNIGGGGGGGAIGVSGTNAANDGSAGGGKGGGSGGSGGGHDNGSGAFNDPDSGPGGGGGRILPGVGGTTSTGSRDYEGGLGGSAGSVGGNAPGAGAGAGGGGWGAAGGSSGSNTGGSGGAAIAKQAGTTLTLNNGGTIYGTV
jgi:hypothetical protein